MKAKELAEILLEHPDFDLEITYSEERYDEMCTLYTPLEGNHIIIGLAKRCIYLDAH